MKLLTSILLTVFLLTTVFGQENRIDIGLEGSPGIFFLRGNEFIKNYHQLALGFSGGLSFQYNFPKILSIRTNIAYERKGSEFNSTITYIDQYGNELGSDKLIVHFNFDYLTMPILVRATIGKKIKYFLNTGLFFGYLIKESELGKATTYFPAYNNNNTNLFKRFDFGISTGLGVLIPIKSKFFICCEIRNNLGLLNVSAVPVYNDGTIKTNSTNLLIGVGYKLWTRQEK